jgi:archaellum component FlaC
MSKKPMTIDDLARMVQDGFAESKSHTDKQFAEVGKRLEQMDKRFVQIDERFDQVDRQFTEVHQELRTIRKQLEGVVYRPEFEALQDRMRDVERFLTTLKKKAA